MISGAHVSPQLTAAGSDFCAILPRKRVRHSDFVRSDLKEDAIEIPRIFVEIREDCP